MNVRTSNNLGYLSERNHTLSSRENFCGRLFLSKILKKKVEIDLKLINHASSRAEQGLES